MMDIQLKIWMLTWTPFTGQRLMIREKKIHHDAPSEKMPFSTFETSNTNSLVKQRSPISIRSNCTKRHPWGSLKTINFLKYEINCLAITWRLKETHRIHLTCTLVTLTCVMGIFLNVIPLLSFVLCGVLCTLCHTFSHTQPLI